MHIFVVANGRWQICRLLCNKYTKTKLKYNFSSGKGSFASSRYCSPLQLKSALIGLKVFKGSRYESRIIFPGIFSHESRELVRVCGSFE